MFKHLLVPLDGSQMAEVAKAKIVVYEGFPHYGGIAGHDMEALAQGIRESVDESIVAHYVDQSAYLGGLLQDAGVPIVATEVAGIPEAIRHSQEGVLVRPGDHGRATELLATPAD